MFDIYLYTPICTPRVTTTPPHPKYLNNNINNKQIKMSENLKFFTEIHHSNKHTNKLERKSKQNNSFRVIELES